jgi:hypothetical protein
MSADKKDGAPGPRTEGPIPTISSDATGSHDAKQVPLSIDDQQIVDIGKELAELESVGIEDILPLARWSLESLTHLTEYEDEKANRILTAIAFLSALVGVAFAAIVQRYPLSSVTDVRGLSSLAGHSLLLALLYCLFGLYFLLVTIGAAFTVFAVRPTFRVPRVWEHTKKTPASFLFFQEILKVSGKDWGRAFTQNTPEKLKKEYVKNSILESYLIAQKIPKKLRPLRKGIVCFFASTLVLIVLLPFCAVTVAYLDVPAANPAGVAAGSVASKIEIPTTKTAASGGAAQVTPARTKASDEKRGQSIKEDSPGDTEKPQ